MSGTSSSREIFVYFENDFAAEYGTCSGVSGHAEYEVQAEIEAAMETWNQESTGITLHFGGTVPTGDTAVACASYMPKRPAVFVNLHSGCAEDGAGGCRNAIATAADHGSDCSSITFWGDDQLIDDCDGGGNSWAFFDEGGSLFQRTATHELGHIIGLGHIGECQAQADCLPSQDCLIIGSSTWGVCINDTSDTPGSTMNSDGAGHNHLFSWDKDCARYFSDTRTLGRQTKYNYMWYDGSPLGSYYGTSQHTYTTQRGFWGGAGVLDYYGLFDSAGYYDYSARPALGTTSSFSSATAVDSVFDDAHASPTFWSSYGDLPHDNAAFISDEGYPSGATVEEFDPPRVRHVYDNDLLSSPSYPYLQRRVGSSAEYVQTNVPVAVAYDPDSDQPIVAVVDTTKPSGLNRGDIWIHPGFELPYRLNEGELLEDSLMHTIAAPSPAHPNGFTFDLTTDRQVGLACGDEFWTENYNCLLAWQDRGIARGRVLYTYFRVDSANDVKWHGQVFRRSYSRTVAGVSAAYSEGKFFMAWKEWLGGDAVETTWTSSYSGWSSPTERSAPGIVDPPTFLYYSHPPYPATDKNHLVVWTASDVSDNC